MKPLPTIILVEDETNIRRFVRLALEAEECQVYEAETFKRGLIEAGTRQPDLIILDLGLPDGDGVDFIRELRSWSDVPVIVLSARLAECNKVDALDAGADDYLTKPFGTAELLARVRAHLRRCASVKGAENAVVEFGNVRIDLARRVAEKDGQDLHLTPIEFRLLSYLVSNPDCVLTYRQILKAVWGPSHTDRAPYVRVYMGHLRQKIEDDPARPQHLLTESGVGYRFMAYASNKSSK
ncbi:MAG: KDP operon transcriptional regulatory protein KdpE [Betaproteobacteria bacterium ADurb.Bin341]|nr:MAG: KDP operon transcriptional regulatory protein KdpE [Betaproteobacteria bacterium ADurb.Bin341]